MKNFQVLTLILSSHEHTPLNHLVSHEFKAELERAKRAEDESAPWFKTNPDLLSSKNSLEKWKEGWLLKVLLCLHEF